MTCDDAMCKMYQKDSVIECAYCGMLLPRSEPTYYTGIAKLEDLTAAAKLMKCQLQGYQIIDGSLHAALGLPQQRLALCLMFKSRLTSYRKFLYDKTRSVLPFSGNSERVFCILLVK